MEKESRPPRPFRMLGQMWHHRPRRGFCFQDQINDVAVDSQFTKPIFPHAQTPHAGYRPRLIISIM
jgi:hypothetical protein